MSLKYDVTTKCWTVNTDLKEFAPEELRPSMDFNGPVKPGEELSSAEILPKMQNPEDGLKSK